MIFWFIIIAATLACSFLVVAEVRHYRAVLADIAHMKLATMEYLREATKPEKILPREEFTAVIQATITTPSPSSFSKPVQRKFTITASNQVVTKIQVDIPCSDEVNGSYDAI